MTKTLILVMLLSLCAYPEELQKPKTEDKHLTPVQQRDLWKLAFEAAQADLAASQTPEAAKAKIARDAVNSFVSMCQSSCGGDIVKLPDGQYDCKPKEAAKVEKK